MPLLHVCVIDWDAVRACERVDDCDALPLCDTVPVDD
jgi:hypothetical protein